MKTGRYVIKFSFDGRSFTGYARQPGGGTVEDELIAALMEARLISDPKDARFASASRVDRGVSAISAAAAFDTGAARERVLRSINAKTRGILAHSIAEVEVGFDPRRRASSRQYRYHFPPSHLPSGLDIPRMRRAAELFLGEHDFTAFARLEGRNSRRVISSIVLEGRPGSLVMDVNGKSFLWNQVRRMASALAMVGAGEIEPEAISRALSSGEGGPFPPSPPEGLFLMDVVYDDLEFQSGPDLPRGTIERLEREYHQEVCALRYYDYLRDIVRF